MEGSNIRLKIYGGRFVVHAPEPYIGEREKNTVICGYAS
jgi:hypothetical protein